MPAKLVKLREQKADVDDYVKKLTSKSSTSLGDLFGDAFKAATPVPEVTQTKPDVE